MFRLFISNSEASIDRTGHWPFLRRILTFLFPFVLIGLTMEIALWKTGDTWSPRSALIHQQQSSTESIYGPRFFSDQFNIFKLSGIQHRQPTIITIGSSRVMQIRDIMFHPLEQEFYNGGGLLRNAFDLQAFADMLTQEELPLPKVLIAGIDPWWLRTNYGKATWLNDTDERYSFAGHIEAFRQILKKSAVQQVLTATSSFESPGFGYDAIGTYARIEGTGFRQDGSNLYPSKVFREFMESPVYVDRESPAIIDRIRMTEREFSLPAVIDEERVKIIVDALSLMKRKGIEVIAFMPPFSTEAYEALEHSQPLSQWWDYYTHAFPALLKTHQITVVEVSHPAQFQLNDTAMFDGWHPSEVYIAHIVKKMIESLPASSYLNTTERDHLTTLTQEAESPLAFHMPQRTTTH